jgi:hypothetical protein
MTVASIAPSVASIATSLSTINFFFKLTLEFIQFSDQQTWIRSLKLKATKMQTPKGTQAKLPTLMKTQQILKVIGAGYNNVHFKGSKMQTKNLFLHTIELKHS